MADGLVESHPYLAIVHKVALCDIYELLPLKLYHPYTNNYFNCVYGLRLHAHIIYNVWGLVFYSTACGWLYNLNLIAF